MCQAAEACRTGGETAGRGRNGACRELRQPEKEEPNKGLTIRTGQTHVNRWSDDLLRRIEDGQIDPSFVVTHTADLEAGPDMYKTFRDKEDGCIKVVLKP